jgi:hypothetical protein
VIYGLGPMGYELALDAIASLLLHWQDGGATAPVCDRPTLGGKS